VTADQLGRLLGYPAPAAGQALDTLESLGLIRRSRAVRGVRLVQFECSAAVLERLADRSGRLLVGKTLRMKNPEWKRSVNGGEASDCA
jgi:hypothetical protein